MRSFSKKPNWDFRISKSYRGFIWKPKMHRTYSLNEPMWKDKFGTPRCERVPYIEIHWLGLCLYIWRGEEHYWEKWLWIHKYNNGDELKAKQTWPWVEFKTKKSTWFNEY